MHHKRGKPKNQRAGCLLCKPQKMNGAGRLKKEVHKVGFGRLRAEVRAAVDLAEHGRSGILNFCPEAKLQIDFPAK